MKAEVPAPVMITRVAARSSKGRTKRSTSCFLSTSAACVLCSIAGCCAISVAVASAPSACSSLSSRPSLAIARRMIIIEYRAHMRHRQLGGAASDAAVPERGMRERQILADQCGRRRIAGEVAEHRLLCADNLGLGPIVTDALAQAVLQLVIERGAAAVVIFPPVARLGLHARDRETAEAGSHRRRNPFAFDRVKTPERLAQRKCESRPDLEDREMIAHQRRERGARLIVGGMGFEYQTTASLDHDAQRTRLLRCIGDDLAMVEFDSGLRHQRDHPRPGLREAGLRELRAMGVDGRARIFGRRDGKRVQLLRSPARRGDLGADDIDRRLPLSTRMGALGGCAQTRRAGGDRLAGKGRAIVRTRHRAIEMDLAEACGHIILDQCLRARHGSFCAQGLPDVGTEVATAENNAMAIKAEAIRDAMDEVAEAHRRHAGIAALLIDLVRGRFDQRERRARTPGVKQRRLDHQRMRGAHGKHAAGLARLVPRDAIDNGPHAVSSSGVSESKTAAMQASAMPTSFKPPGTLPSASTEMTAAISGAPALASGHTTMAWP